MPTDTAFPVHRHRPHDRARVHRAGYRPPRWRSSDRDRTSIWRGIEVLEGMDRRERPSTARSTHPARRSLSATPVPAR